MEGLRGVTLVGIGHKCRQGKDTAASKMRDSLPDQVRIYHFADALKDYCRDVYGMEEKDPALLQRVGTEFRQRDKDFWVKAVLKKIAEDRPLIAVVPDCRYRNEAEFIRRAGGYLIHVCRLNADGTPFISEDRDPNHPSETDLDSWKQWDYRLIARSGEIDDLERQALSALGDIKFRLRI